MSSRYSTPPSLARLGETTQNLTHSNNVLAAKVGALPMPAPTPRVALSDEQRVQVCREILRHFFDGGHVELDKALESYEQAALRRLGR